MYGKIINDSLIRAPKKIKHAGRWFFNASETIMREEGWLPVIMHNPPEAPEGYLAMERYVITLDSGGQQVIEQQWDVIPER